MMITSKNINVLRISFSRKWGTCALSRLMSVVPNGSMFLKRVYHTKT